ncbi:MAG: hypothetical protein SXQ77_01315, partial [Halobacteria archaeon]|nr:hypothetical protein [Halobacteria archaeon]
LVSRGIVEKTGDSYRVADSEVVEALLEGRETDANTSTSASVSDISLPTSLNFDRRNAGILATLLLFTVALRTYIYPKVFRNADVVLLSNDPYYYLYFVENLVAGAQVTGPINKSEPLMVHTLSFITDLIGGVDSAAMVLAWYPVASAVITAVLVYVFATRLTDDVRVGFAAVAFLAVTPAHAF